MPNPKLFVEKKKDFEQYFFTDKILEQITTTFRYINNIVCICAPSVADAFWRFQKKEVYCIDIDDRFNYLPKFIHCDITKDEVKLPENFIPDLIIIDPPFFGLKMIDLFNFVEKITKQNKKTKIAIGYIIREEKTLLTCFKEYNLQMTKFKMEYRTVDQTKWNNYAMYTNFEDGKLKYVFKKKRKKIINKIINISINNIFNYYL